MGDYTYVFRSRNEVLKSISNWSVEVKEDCNIRTLIGGDCANNYREKVYIHITLNHDTIECR